MQSTLQVIQGYYCWANGSFGVLLLVSVCPLYPSCSGCCSSTSPSTLPPTTTSCPVCRSSSSDSVDFCLFRYVRCARGDHLPRAGQWHPQRDHCGGCRGQFLPLDAADPVRVYLWVFDVQHGFYFEHDRGQFSDWSYPQSALNFGAFGILPVGDCLFDCGIAVVLEDERGTCAGISELLPDVA